MVAADPIRLNPRTVNLTGRRFGRLLVVGFAGYMADAMRQALWECVCDCGTHRRVKATGLRSGTTTSCGCLRRENFHNRKHGGSYTREYRVWVQIKERCLNGRSAQFENYGGRGIKVCARWRHSFTDFISDVGKRPSDRHSIDRIDNDGHYSCGECEECKANSWPMNVRWATARQQCRNTRRNRPITVFGHTMLLTDWAVQSGIPYTLILTRLARGRSPEEAVAPVGSLRR